MKENGETSNIGAVISVRGSVVDVRFEDYLPPINSLLKTGKDGQIVIEVWAQLSMHIVRGIALTPTQGLARGMAVTDTGGPLQVPVGKAILSRMFDVFGNVIDKGEALSDVEWRPVHRTPPSLAERSTKSEIFETGIKAIDVLLPLERGGKAGAFRRRRRRQDRPADGDHSQYGRASRRRGAFSAASVSAAAKDRSFTMT